VGTPPSSFGSGRFERAARNTYTSEPNKPLRMAEVVSALSHALDLSTGQPIGHSVRTCILGMRIAHEIGLSGNLLNDLYYALLLKDAGCSSNASLIFRTLNSDDLKAKRDVKTTDWSKLGWESLQYALAHVAEGKPFLERVRTLARLAANQKRHAQDLTKLRCERGASMARLIGLGEGTADGIASLDELWNGAGNPDGLKGQKIPLLSRIMLLAQTLEVFFTTSSPETAVQVAIERSGRWFDPHLVNAARSLNSRGTLWAGFDGRDSLALSLQMDVEQRTMDAGDMALDSICLAFAQIVDSKSPFTYNHSNGVANATVAIAQTLGFEHDRILFLRHAALLHDLGKLGVSNSILEKPGKLDDEEWKLLRLHPFLTWKVLKQISGFEELSEVAASHHEKLDGTGYFRGLTGEAMSLDSRILVVADIFDALSAQRPYRDALSREKVFEIMRKDSPRALDPVCLEALEQSGVGCDQTFIDLQTLSRRIASAQHRPQLGVSEFSSDSRLLSSTIKAL
jgi:HD-GYP domain-containing protein (c-di-GMP phosphodiesterase class II)